MGSSIIKLGLVLAALAFETQAFSTNLVLNGWFYGWNGVGTVPNDWTLTRATSGSFFGENLEGPGTPPEGGNAASFAATSSSTNFPADYDEISETISTTPGAVYGVSFYLKPYPGSYFVADFGDHQLLALAPASGAYAWTQYSYLVAADSTSMTLAFYGNGNDTGVGKLVHVADVDVELVPIFQWPVPNEGDRRVQSDLHRRNGDEPDFVIDKLGPAARHQSAIQLIFVHRSQRHQPGAILPGRSVAVRIAEPLSC